MSLKNRILQLYQAGALIAWLVFFIITYYSVKNGGFNQVDSSYVSPLFRDITLNIFILITFLYFRLKSEKPKSENFNDLLWECFMTSTLMVVALLLNQQLTYLRIDFFENNIIKNAIYAINSIFIIIFCGKVFFTYKRLILYQKTKNLLFAWQLYEVLLVICLLISHFEIDHFHLNTLVFVASLGLYGLGLSLSMKWIAYLNFKQKLRGALLLFLILLIAASFIQYLYSYSHLTTPSTSSIIINDISQHFFIIVILIFIIFYCISSILVILFNLPTSSVFEQKLGEVFNFQKLAQSIRTTKNEKEMYEVLLDISTNTTLADAAWLEIHYAQEDKDIFLKRNIEKESVNELKIFFKQNGINKKESQQYLPNILKLKGASLIEDKQIKCVSTFPLYIGEKNMGTLGLIKYIPDGFNNETIEVIQSFVNQACISIENSHLLNEAIETERYKEELKIAKEIQKNLLPKKLTFDKPLKIAALSVAADDVGGDYYDTFNISEDIIGVIIGDVSGHGTSAAFNMAQVKGVFQGLMQLSNSPNEILRMANNALSNCLDKQSFVTVTILMIDLKNELISISRAGHCPTLFFDQEKNKVDYLNMKGLGLGILRNNNYINHIENYFKEINRGDLLLLYTDGVVEAKNEEKEEYGYVRLKAIFEKNITESPLSIIEQIKHDVLIFNKKEKTEDDFTLLCIKFM